MKKSKLSGLGKAYLIILFVIMMARFFFWSKTDLWYMRLAEGALRFIVSFFGSGMIFLILFAAFYFAIKISTEINDPPAYSEKELMEHGEKLAEPFFIVCYMISYIILLLDL